MRWWVKVVFFWDFVRIVTIVLQHYPVGFLKSVKS